MLTARDLHFFAQMVQKRIYPSQQGKIILHFWAVNFLTTV